MNYNYLNQARLNILILECHQTIMLILHGNLIFGWCKTQLGNML